MDERPSGTVPKDLDLEAIFRLEETRTLSNDWVVRYQNRLFQIRKQSRNYAPAKGKVTVCEWEDGRIKIYYREQEIPWKEIQQEQQEPTKMAPVEELRRVAHRPRPAVPARNHPWKQNSFRDMIPRKKIASKIV